MRVLLLQLDGKLPNVALMRLAAHHKVSELELRERSATLDEDRDERRRLLRDFGARPYPMPYTRTRELVSFQRWVIGGYDKSVPWATWCAARGEPRRLDIRETPQLRLELHPDES